MIDLEQHQRTLRRAHATWASVVIALVLIMLGMAASTEQPEGVCSGIGWGCELSGAALAGFVAMLIVPVAVVVLPVGHLLISAVGGVLRHRRG